MKIRVKSKWNNKDRERTVAEIGSALGFNIWRIAGANVLHMENEGYQTDTYNMRLDIIAELTAFMVHVVDRMALEKTYSEDKRRELITALALNLAMTMQDNRIDANTINDKDRAQAQEVAPEKADYKAPFIDLLNARMSEYSAFSFDGKQPGFQLRRRVGEHVTLVIGEKDRKWVTDQVMDIEIPDAMKVFARVAQNLL
jgi:hypothetical protein